MRSSSEEKVCRKGRIATDPDAVAKMTTRGFMALLFALKGSAAPNDNAEKQLPGKVFSRQR